MNLADFKLDDNSKLNDSNSRVNDTLMALDLGPLAGILGGSVQN